MGALTRPLAALALLVAAPLFASESCAREAAASERWRGLASEAADRFGLPVEWVMRVIEAESAGRTTLGGRPITSHAGAMGLMQIMPATWASLRAQFGLGADPHDPRDNILAGTAYLRAMYNRFGYPGLFGAYNAGPGRYGDYVANGRPLPRETHDYMARIMGGSPARAKGRTADAGRHSPIPTRGVDPIFLARSGLVGQPAGAGAAEGAAGFPVSPITRLEPAGHADGLFALRRDRVGPGQ